MTTNWTVPSDIAARLRRRWDDGSLLRAHGAREPFPTFEVSLHGPTPSQIAQDLSAARKWATRLEEGSRDGRHFDLIWREVGGRAIGRNRIPARAVVGSYAQAWALLKVASHVATFDELLAKAGPHEAVLGWMLRRPHTALGLASEIDRLIAAWRWLETSRQSGAYLRQISAPGVDTKFAELHRGVLAEILGVPASTPGFLAGLGLAAKPILLRIRPSPRIGLPSPLTELGVRADELARLDFRPASALIAENEITYLSVPVPEGGLVLWGRGFGVGDVGRLPWLTDVPIDYWGDLDTHGFAILNRLRAFLPQTRSLLMDADTLLSHRDRWVVEQRPTHTSLSRLTQEEVEVYRGLVEDRWGARLRLEQERIDWSWALDHLPASGRYPSSSE